MGQSVDLRRRSNMTRLSRCSQARAMSSSRAKGTGADALELGGEFFAMLSTRPS